MYLGIDLGTGSVKVMMLNADGGEVTATRPYPVDAPAPGRSETTPTAWTRALQAALADLGSLSSVESIGLSGQMHGVVLVRRTVDGQIHPVRPAILWSDGRGADHLSDYAQLPSDLTNDLANVPAAGMAGPTLRWLRKHEAQTLDEADYALFPKDYIRAELTGEIATDYSDASGSLLYSFAARDWHYPLLQRFDISPSLLPPIRYSTGRAGAVTPAAAARFGLPAGIPVAYGAGDTPAAMYGTNLIHSSVAQISVGTAAQVSRAVDPAEGIPPVSSLNLFEGATRDMRFQVAAMLNGGLALEWVRDRLGFSWSELYSRLVGTTTDDPGGLLFLPHLSGERTPFMNPNARGAWVGLSRYDDNDSMARAALLGVACTVRLGLETLEQDRRPITEIRLVGGSARFSEWRRILTMVLERPIVYSENADSSARGAAFMAARMVGDEPPNPPPFYPEDVLRAPWVGEYYRQFLAVYHALNP
ncbi:MAG: xylulokinase [Alkalispirochaeta sp.]